MKLALPLLFELLNLECPRLWSSSLSMLTPLVISPGLMIFNIHILITPKFTSLAQTLLMPRLIYIQLPSQHFHLDGQESSRYITLNISQTELLIFPPFKPAPSIVLFILVDGARWSGPGVLHFFMFSLSTSSWLLPQAIYRI